MTPDVPKVLGVLRGALTTAVLPETKSPFVQQSVGLSATLLTLLAQDYDRAAARLAEENLAVRALLQLSAGIVDAQLRARIDCMLVRPANADLHVSELTNENSELRAALIDVHAAIERSQSARARSLNEAIWAELRQSVARRHVDGVLG